MPLLRIYNSLGQVGHYLSHSFPASRTLEDAHVIHVDDNFGLRLKIATVKVKKNKE